MNINKCIIREYAMLLRNRSPERPRKVREFLEQEIIIMYFF